MAFVQAVLVERLLRGSMEQEQSAVEGTNLLAAEERMNSTGPAVSSASSVMQQHSFWAKGTGFGSGTTQQQWNVGLHVLKRKQDEQNVTHLLRVYFVSLARNCDILFSARIVIDSFSFEV